MAKKETLGAMVKDTQPKQEPETKPEQKTPPKKTQAKKPQSQPPAKAPINIFRQQLNKYEKNLVKLLEDHSVSAEKFIVVVENAVRAIPKLLECERGSLFGCVLTAAEFGLEPNTPAQLSWIIPYESKKSGIIYAQFQLGYHGIIELLYRNERIKNIMTQIVYEGDLYERHIDAGMNWVFRYVPAEYSARGKRRGVFAVIHMANAEPLFHYLSAQEVAEIRSKSKSPHTYDPKNDPQGWMWRKAALKQCAKMAPKGYTYSHTGKALNVDSMIEGGATVILDEKGQVVVHKDKQRRVDDNKLNIVFGDPDAQDADVIDE